MLLAIIICLLLGFVLSRLLTGDGAGTVILTIVLLIAYFIVAVLVSGQLREVTLISEKTYPILEVQDYMTGGGRLDRVRNRTRFYFEVDGERKEVTKEEPVYTITGEDTIIERVCKVTYSENEVLDKILHYIFFSKEVDTYYTVTK